MDQQMIDTMMARVPTPPDNSNVLAPCPDGVNCTQRHIYLHHNEFGECQIYQVGCVCPYGITRKDEADGRIIKMCAQLHCAQFEHQVLRPLIKSPSPPDGSKYPEPPSQRAQREDGNVIRLPGQCVNMVHEVVRTNDGRNWRILICGAMSPPGQKYCNKCWQDPALREKVSQERGQQGAKVYVAKNT